MVISKHRHRNGSPQLLGKPYTMHGLMLRDKVIMMIMYQRTHVDNWLLTRTEVGRLMPQEATHKVGYPCRVSTANTPLSMYMELLDHHAMLSSNKAGMTNRVHNSGSSRAIWPTPLELQSMSGTTYGTILSVRCST